MKRILAVVLLLLCVPSVSKSNGNNLAFAIATPSYAELRLQAIAENKTLIVWVGDVCLPDESKLPNCLHYHTPEFNGSKATGVLVSVPWDGKLWYVSPLAGLPTVNSIKMKIAETMSARPVTPPKVVDPFQPMFQHQSIPMMRSGGGRSSC